MTRVDIFNTDSQNPALILTTYASGYAVAVPTARSFPLVFFSELAGPTSVQFDLSFGVSTVGNVAPDPADDTQWYGLVANDGTAISTESTVLPGRSIIDLSTKLTATAGALVWKGWVPQGVSWVRVRVKRTGSAVTTLKLTMVSDGRYISG